MRGTPFGHRAERHELASGGGRDQAGERRLAGARRSPEDHRARNAALDGLAQRLARRRAGAPVRRTRRAFADASAPRAAATTDRRTATRRLDGSAAARRQGTHLSRRSTRKKPARRRRRRRGDPSAPRLEFRHEVRRGDIERDAGGNREPMPRERRHALREEHPEHRRRAENGGAAERPGARLPARQHHARDGHALRQLVQQHREEQEHAQPAGDEKPAGDGDAVEEGVQREPEERRHARRPVTVWVSSPKWKWGVKTCCARWTAR